MSLPFPVTTPRGRKRSWPFTPPASRNVLRLADNVVRTGLLHYSQSESRSRSRSANMDATPLYGGTFTSKVAYRRHRAPKRVRIKARKRARRFLNQSLKLQNAQNSLRTGMFASTTPGTNNTQSWASLDLLDVEALREFSIGQLPLFKLNPVTGTIDSGGPNASQWRDFELYIKTFNLNFYLHNTTNGDVSIDLYVITPKRDISYLEMYEPGVPNGNTFANWLNNNLAVGTGKTSDMLPDPHGEGVPTTSSLGFNLFMYQNFTKLFTVEKIRTLQMSAGDKFQDKYRVKNVHVNMARMGGVRAVNNPNIEQQGNWYIKGVSKIIAWRFRGWPDATPVIPTVTLSTYWEETCTAKVIQTRPSSSAFLGAA